MKSGRSPVHAQAGIPVAQLGAPAVLKTAAFGYDGKGQAKLNQPADVDAAWRAIGEQEAVLEAFVPFVKEVSMVAARMVLSAVHSSWARAWGRPSRSRRIRARAPRRPSVALLALFMRPLS